MSGDMHRFNGDAAAPGEIPGETELSAALDLFMVALCNRADHNIFIL